jgi:hypothetical protein
MDWNERQTALIELLADVTDKRTKEDKCEAVGFTPKYVYVLLRNPDFREAVTERIRSNISIDSLPRILGRLAQQAVEQDTKNAAELVLKALGVIAPGGGQVNVTNVQQREDNNESFAERLHERFEERVETYRRSGGANGITKREDEDE